MDAVHDMAAPPGSDDELPPPHATLPGFRLLEEIHRGGQGTVHRAVHEASGRLVALKILTTGSARRRARMEREARLAAALSHPNIVTLLDCGHLPDGRYALALELIRGEPLDAWARAVRGEPHGPRAAQRRLLEVFARICNAVQHAHGNGVIHRDLKPDNILVGADDQPHVLDFGVAVWADESMDRDAAGRVTATGELACTLAYASPEQVAGHGARIDARSDVYALGRILYELLTGRPPYPIDGSIGDLVESITSRQPAPMRDPARRHERGAVGADLETVTLKALAKDPAHRYRTAAELEDDVRRVLAGEAIGARRESTLYLLGRALRRHRGPVLATALALAGLAGGGAAIAVSAVSGARAAARAAIESARSQLEADRSRTISAVLRELVPAEKQSADYGGSGPAHQAIAALGELLESGSFAADPKGAATTRMILGEVCLDRGAPRLAEENLRLAVRQFLLLGDAESLELAEALDGLARVLLTRNELREAEERCLASLAIRRRRLAAHHADLAEGRALLARIRLVQGAVPAAQVAWSEGVAACDDVSAQDRMAAASLAEVASELAQRHGDLDSAVAHAERALTTRVLEASDSDPTLVRSVQVLASAIQPGDPLRAEALLHLARQLAGTPPTQRSVEALRTLLGLKERLAPGNDAERLETLSLLSPRLRLTRHLDDAWLAANEALELGRRQYGEVDLRVADLYMQRAYVKGFVAPAEDPTGLEDWLARLAIHRCILTGVDDFYLAIHLREAAGMLEDVGRRAESDALHEEAIDLLRCRFGEESRELAWCLALRGVTLAIRGEAEEGLSLLDTGLEMQRLIDPLPNFYAMRMHAWAGWVCIEQGRLEDARRHFERSAAIRNGCVGNTLEEGAASGR